MTQLAPLTRDQRKVDADHLRILSVLHFVSAGLAILGLLFLFGHYTLFNTIFSDPKMWEGQKQSPPPAELFAMFKWFYVVGGVWFIGSGVLNLLSGFYIRARKNRGFSLFVAGTNCLHMPLGTILGAFTIIVLVRDSVREVYEANRGAEPGIQA